MSSYWGPGAWGQIPWGADTVRRSKPPADYTRQVQQGKRMK